MIAAHFADSHFSSQGSMLDPESGLNARLMDRVRCTRFVISDAIERGAQIILCAGDLFNSSRPTPTERRLAIEALQPAITAGIPVVLLLGNHEASKSPLDKHALDTMRELEGVTVVDRPCLLNVFDHDGSVGAVMLDGEDPIMGDMPIRLQIACLPFPQSNLLLRDDETRALDPGARNLLVREHMMNVARGLAADRIDGVPRILLGHFSVDVAAAGAQDRLMMLGAEWTLNLQEIEALGFDAVLLGHIHKPQRLGSEDGPLVAYSGSPEACTFGEEGEEKQYLLWRFEQVAEAGGPPGVAVGVDSIPTPYRRLVTLKADVDFAGDGELYKVEALDARGAIVRLQVPAAMADRVTEMRRQIEAAGAFEVRIEVERAESVRRRETEISATMGPTEALSEWIVQKPDFLPLKEHLLAEAGRVEEALGGAS